MIYPPGKSVIVFTLLLIFLDLTFVAKHSFPSVSADALEREVAVTVDAPRQTYALRTVSSCPADLALASVGPETHVPTTHSTTILTRQLTTFLPGAIAIL